MRKIYSLTLFLSFVTTIVFAQTKLKDNLFLKKLLNGLDVLVVEDNSVPLATIMITFKTGAITETREMAGVNGVYQAMLFKANKDFETARAFSYHLGQLGVLRGNLTNDEYSCTYFTLPKSNLDEGLVLMNTAIRFPKMREDELKGEIKNTDNQLSQRESNPFFVLEEGVRHHLWGDLVNRKEALGTHESISAINPQQMDIIKNMYYYPNNALLTVAGDVNHDDILKIVSEIYGDWKPSAFDPFTKWPIPEFKPLDKPDYVVVESKLSLSPQITIAWQGPDTRRDIRSTYAADVFSYILNQNSSRLNKALVQSGLASNISFNYLTLKYVGPITLSITPNPSKIKECMAEVSKQLAMMDNVDYFDDDQIAIAKRKLEISQIRTADITTNYVQSLAFWWASASLDYFQAYLDDLKKVNRADLQTYIRKYIKNKPYCAGLLINPELNAHVNARTFFTATN